MILVGQTSWSAADVLVGLLGISRTLRSAGPGGPAQTGRSALQTAGDGMTPQAHRDDQAARTRIRESLAESLIVEASAGTGKTSELVRRIVRVLATGLTTIDKIVAVTFTNKAAGELKLRLRKELDEARAHAPTRGGAPASRPRSEHLEEAAIGTIHAFCAQILHERPVEAVVDPAFQELSQPEAERLYQRAFRGWIQQKLGESAPGLRRAFARMAWQETVIGERSPMEQLQETGRKLVEWRDFPGAVARRGVRSRGRDRCPGRARAKSWPRCAGSASDGRITCCALLRPLTRTGGMDRAGRAEPGARLRYAGKPAAAPDARSAARQQKRHAAPFAEGVPRADVVARRDELLAGLEQFRRRADADLAATLRAEMWGVVDRYQELKAPVRQARFRRPAASGAQSRAQKPEVRRYLQERFSHIFVDEFQDTDPLQAEILLLLAAADPDETRLAGRDAEARQAVRGRRSEAIDLQVPPRRRAALPGRCASARASAAWAWCT